MGKFKDPVEKAVRENRHETLKRNGPTIGRRKPDLEKLKSWPNSVI